VRSPIGRMEEPRLAAGATLAEAGVIVAGPLLPDQQRRATAAITRVPVPVGAGGASPPSCLHLPPYETGAGGVREEPGASFSGRAEAGEAARVVPQRTVLPRAAPRAPTSLGRAAVSAPLPRVGDRLRSPLGFVWRVVCRGETFLTLVYGSGRSPGERRYVPLRDWPVTGAALTPLPGRRP
jgi:hypothetical protein